MDHRRVLWVTPERPDHAGGGGQLRQAHLLSAVGGAFPTHLIVAGALTDDRVRASVASVTEVPLRPPPPLETWTHRKWRLLRHELTERLPWDEALAGAQRRVLGAALRRTVAPGDVVVLEHLQLAPLLADLPPTVRHVLTVHYDGARQAAQRAALAPTTRNRWFWRSQARRVRALQRRAGRLADVVVAVSDEDAAALGAVVVPNGVDLGAFRPTPLPDRPQVVLTATLDYAPNVDGARWFAEAVWPRVLDRRPDAVLELVGRRPLPAVRALADADSVSVHPDVPAIQPYLARARVAVVPLRLGGGTRLKALEAMAAGRVLVGTSVGVEGLGVEDGVHALVADDPADLAEAVLRGLEDGPVAVRVAREGRRLVEERYGWDAIGARFVSVLDDLVGATAPRR